MAALTATLLWAVALAADRYVALFMPTYYNWPSRTQFVAFCATLWLASLTLGGIASGVYCEQVGGACVLLFRWRHHASLV